MPSVFISYSRKDQLWREHLAKHLGALQYEGLLDIWDDQQIGAGDEWLKNIETAIERASVAVLLISADFLTSKFILGKEVPRFLERRSLDRTTVFPVIVRHCPWEDVSWLAPLQARPLNGRPLKDFRSWERELAKIAREILQLARSKHQPQERISYPQTVQHDFLTRVEVVCRLKERGAEVERVQGTGTFGPYLQVWRMTDGIPTIYPVGAVEHGLSRASLQAFSEETRQQFPTRQSELPFVLVYDGETAPDTLVQYANEQRIQLIRFPDYQKLIDFRPYLRRQTLKLARDPVYPPRIYVPQRMRYYFGTVPEETFDAVLKVQEWLTSAKGSFLVIRGSRGSGKTFLLRELARRMGRENGPIPVLLQMRHIEKEHDIRSLVTDHFYKRGTSKRRGAELVQGFTPRNFLYMLEQGHVVLLFDGFDEFASRVTDRRAIEHFDTLLQASTGAAKVVVTSTRQHFLSDQQVQLDLAEKVAAGIGYRYATLQPFNHQQTRAFFTKFFPDADTVERRLRLLNQLDRDASPRLLRLVAELSEDQLQEVEHGGNIGVALINMLRQLYPEEL